MEHTKKMALVDPRLLEGLRQPNSPYPLPPTVKALNTLDQDMEVILKNASLSNEDKIQQYQQVLQRYLTYHDQYQNKMNPVQVQTTTTTTSPTPDKGMLEQDILASVPPSLRRRAGLLLHRVKLSRYIGWNDRGELVLNGKAIPDTNMIDLINDALRERQQFQPPGRALFAEGLKALNIPRDWVRNKAWWSEPSTDTPLQVPIKTGLETPQRPRRTQPRTLMSSKTPSPLKTFIPTPSTRRQRHPGLRPTSTLVQKKPWTPY